MSRLKIYSQSSFNYLRHRYLNIYHPTNEGKLFGALFGIGSVSGFCSGVKNFDDPVLGGEVGAILGMCSGCIVAVLAPVYGIIAPTAAIGAMYYAVKRRSLNEK